MKYMLLNRDGRAALLLELADMPDFLAAEYGSLQQEFGVRAGSDGLPSPVEQCWHLADLEREGFAVRIERLRREDRPVLADFDGARIARERDYKRRSIATGIEEFRRARLANIATLGTVLPQEWTRAGTQDGVGLVTLCDIPQMMVEHDRSHRAELAAWRAGVGELG